MSVLTLTVLIIDDLLRDSIGKLLNLFLSL